jgi:hypothetical protein
VPLSTLPGTTIGSASQGDRRHIIKAIQPLLVREPVGARGFVDRDEAQVCPVAGDLRLRHFHAELTKAQLFTPSDALQAQTILVLDPLGGGLV